MHISSEEVPRAVLAETYAQMSTEEVLDHWESGTLTRLANEVAAAELRRRGVALPPQAEVDEDKDEELPGLEANFETIARSFEPTEMHILCGRLEAEGIPAFVINDNSSLPAVATGDVRLQVASEYAQDAARVIADIRAGRRNLADSEKLPETPNAWETGAEESQGRTTKEAALPPAPNWQVLAMSLVFIYAVVEFAKTMWFTRTFGNAIAWDYVSMFALALPVLYFAAALLMVCGSKWAIPGFAVYLPLNMAVALFFMPDDPLRTDQFVGWLSTGAIIYFCVLLRRQGRLD
ncbi:MAG: DUF2007 domain-containing protein [Burkholderiaceae bacterium]|nr:DUF2007 domain-containing protein [Burkholderiaceae bacterium]